VFSGDLHFIAVQISLNDNANNTLGTSSGEMLDNKEIDDTLDEFSKMLSDYVCDGNPVDQAAPSTAQTRLESLFTPPNKIDNPSHLSSTDPSQSTARLPDSMGSAIRGNPGTSPTSAEDEASIK